MADTNSIFSEVASGEIKVLKPRDRLIVASFERNSGENHYPATAIAQPYMDEMHANKEVVAKTQEYFQAEAINQAAAIKDVTSKESAAAFDKSMDAMNALQATFDAAFKKAHPTIMDSVRIQAFEGYLELTKQENLEKSGANAGKDAPAAPVKNAVTPTVPGQNNR